MAVRGLQQVQSALTGDGKLYLATLADGRPAVKRAPLVVFEDLQLELLHTAVRLTQQGSLKGLRLAKIDFEPARMCSPVTSPAGIGVIIKGLRRVVFRAVLVHVGSGGLPAESQRAGFIHRFDHGYVAGRAIQLQFHDRVDRIAFVRRHGYFDARFGLLHDRRAAGQDSVAENGPFHGG